MNTNSEAAARSTTTQSRADAELIERGFVLCTDDDGRSYWTKPFRWF